MAKRAYSFMKPLMGMGYQSRMTGHGFRALAMSIIKQELGYRHEVVDRQLAHAPKNRIDAAYDSALLLADRKVMMQEWADYIEGVSKVLKNKEFHILINEEIPEGSKVASIISEHTDLSKQAVKQAMKKGALWVEDAKGIRRLRRADTIAPRQSTLHFYYAPDVLESVPPMPALISDERDYSVWYKPPNMLSQGSKWGDHCTINRWIESNTPFKTQPQRNCFVVHRLDRAARGLMLIAHKKSVAAKLSSLFEKRDIDKRYRVIVEGEFPEEEQVLDTEIDGKAAHSIASRIEFSSAKNRTLLEVAIKTGRKHQIRIHMSRAGYPVVGDRLHGIAATQAELQEELQLSAFSLGYLCPVSGEAKQYKLPEHLQLVF